MDQSAPKSEANAALSGVRVVELSQFDAGAGCAEILAWLGADVVKVESAVSESGRYAATERAGVDSYEFILLNANKRSVMCDLETDRGKQHLRQLIANADVVVEHLAPGVVERLGFGYKMVRELNPRIIYAQIKGFAAGNPRANYLSMDMVAQAVGGAVSGTGDAGEPPLAPGIAIADTGAALHSAMGILSALYQRQVTGRGQSVEVAMQDAVINLHRVAYINQSMRGKPLQRTGNGSRSAAVPSNLFACKPGGPNDYVFIHVSKSANKHWQSIAKLMGRSDWAHDPNYLTGQARTARRDEIEALISAWCGERTKVEAMDAIQNAGASAGAVLDTQELSEDAHLRERGMFATIEHPARGAVTMPGWPVKKSESSVAVRSAPLLGAHTQEVLSEWLAPSKQAPLQPSRNAGTNSALAGVRVVDFTQFEAGTSCTEALAWLGADVVKIEEPQRGERGRFGNTDTPGVDAHYFIHLNANKRSLTCDIKSERGKELLRKLIMKADVLAENMAPGVIERLGFGYDVVRQLNPRIIYAQIKGFPSDGPHANYLCFDTIAQAVGGSISAVGAVGGLPLRPGPNIGDTGSGMHCATGIVAALVQRQRTGRGQRVQMAMQESVINFSRAAFARYLALGRPPARHGSRNLYACKGGGANDYCFISTAAASDEQWHRLLQVIGKGDLLNDPRFASRQERSKHMPEMDALLTDWCSERTKIEAMDIMQRAGVPAGAVLDPQEIQDDPELRKNGMFVTIAHPARGPLTIPGWPVRMSESHVPVQSAPLLGTHTEAVLSEWLGLSAAEIQEHQKAVSA